MKKEIHEGVVNMHFRIDKKTYDELRNMSFVKQISMAQLMRRFIQNGLNEINNLTK